MRHNNQGPASNVATQKNLKERAKMMKYKEKTKIKSPLQETACSIAKEDEKWIRRAIQLANSAEILGEVPIGALVVRKGKLISKAFNQKETTPTPIGHAEIIALHRAAKKLKSWRLTDCTLYVTLEPCAMCTGALIQARVQRVVFGAYDPKAGACGSVHSLHSDSRLNHRFLAIGGVLEKECSDILKKFFQIRRMEKKNKIKL